MTCTDFFRHALRTLAEAVARAGVSADLDRHPETITKTVRRRCLAKLRPLAIMIRRLITLIALSVELAPFVPREGRNWFSDEAAAQTPRGYSFRLIPSVPGSPPETGKSVPGWPMPGPVPAAPVIARWHALLDALRHSRSRAERLARTLQRQRAAGLARPYVLPMAKTHRMPPQLGLMAGALTVRLRAAFADWPAGLPEAGADTS